jgi:hypothetical protein
MIYQCEPFKNPEATTKLIYGKNATEITELKQCKDVVKKICDIEGSWLKSLVIDGKKFWDINNDEPMR